MSHFGGNAGYFIANSIAHAAALRAIRRDPIGVARLALQSWSDWFDRNELAAGLHYDRWEYPYSSATREKLRIHFGIQDKALWELSTPTNRWYFASAPWMSLLAVSPFVLLLLGLIAVPRNFRPQMIWIAAIVTCIVAINVGAATKLVPRYMHPVAWVFPLGLCALGALGWRGRGSRRLSSKIAS